MDEFVVYILYSKKFNKNYTGFTSNLIERFRSHNFLETKGYTLKFRPWEVVYVEFFYSKAQAMKNSGILPYFQNGRIVLFDCDKVDEIMYTIKKAK